MSTTETEPSSEATGRDTTEVLGVTIVHQASGELVGARETTPKGRTLVLGRSEECGFPGAFDGSRVSRRHVLLSSDGEALALTDLESHNGTFVNGARVERATVRPGDVLRLGDVLLLVERGPVAWTDPPSSVLIGVSPAIARVKREIALAARSNVASVIGETGTGKELVARALHDGAGRKGEFVAVNCGAIADGVLHSELFGHVAGAFSGASAAREGLVAVARGGSLFLDEITAASPAFQASLLRLIEAGEYRSVGSTATKKADAAFIFALQPGVAELIEGGAFRRDLWSRLSRFSIPLPSLRERRADVPLLGRHFARQAAGRPIELSTDFAFHLLMHDWPLNVRELRDFMERAVMRHGEERLLRWTDLERGDLDASSMGPSQPARAAHAPAVSSDSPAPSPEPSHKRRSPKMRPSKDEVEKLLDAEGGSVTAVARRLGVPRKTLYRWLEQLGVAPRGEP